MKSTFSILFYIDRSKTSERNECIIRCRITCNGASSSFSTGLYTSPNDWQSKKGRIKVVANRANAINLQLNDKSAYSEQGQIESISGVIDRSTGTVSLRAVFPNKEGLLHSGGAGNVIVPVQKTGALTIPQAATFEIQDKRYVYKVVDGKAQSNPVQVTRVNGGREFIVDEGLVPGDVIVAEGVGLLREGTPVKAKAAQTPVAGVTEANQSSSAETINQSSSAETINQSSSAEAINQSSLAETTAQSLSAETATASSATTTEN